MGTTSRCIRSTHVAIWIIAAVTTGILACNIVLLTGGYFAGQTMSGMDAKMSKMTDPIDDIIAAVTDFSTQFPSNQASVTAKQVLGTIKNGYLLSSRGKLLTTNVESGDIGVIADKAAKFASAISPSDVSAITKSAAKIADNLNKIVSQIKPSDIEAVVKTIGSLDSNKVNRVLDAVNKLHEIKIQL